jgi:hypothetical protein
MLRAPVASSRVGAELLQVLADGQVDQGRVVEAAMDARDRLQPGLRLVEDADRFLRVLDDLAPLQGEQGRHELHVVGDPVLQLLEHGALLLVELRAHRPLRAQALARDAHQVNERDVDGDDEGVEGECQPGLRIEQEGVGLADEEVPRGEPREHRANDPRPQAEEERRQDHRREEGQERKARRQHVVQGVAQGHRGTRRAQGGDVAEPKRHGPPSEGGGEGRRHVDEKDPQM